MNFITLIKFKKKVSEVVEVGKFVMKNLPPGVKMIATYWTLGKYDAVWIYEAPSEKDAMKLGISVGDVAETQTLVAVPRDEAMKLL